ncbi:MAG: methylmalonyl Co-A mutase-associated GTPase MeaB [Desulfobacterales bacterium]|nr:methylmalonyl Co-A mutase-associated GTPase MeaB [Desulfobacterales bacterium]
MHTEIKKILAGDQLAGARLIRQLEEGEPDGLAGLKALFSKTGKAYIIGITGPPGAGKSTLVSQMITEFRQQDLKVGVVAVDPSSALTGGAFLGDRLRMRQHTEDAGVFIRSMATRGHMGGLSTTTREVALVLDAMGYDVVIVETVGVGQDEVEIIEFAHTTIVVSLPGTGDEIQSLKAGLLEIGDIFVVNKGDRPGADDEVARLQGMLAMGKKQAGNWIAPVIKTTAVKAQGLSEVVDACWRHHQFLLDEGLFRKHTDQQTVRLFQRLVMDLAADKIFRDNKDTPIYQSLLEDLKNRRIDPVTAAEKLLKNVYIKV